MSAYILTLLPHPCCGVLLGQLLLVPVVPLRTWRCIGPHLPSVQESRQWTWITPTSTRPSISRSNPSGCIILTPAFLIPRTFRPALNLYALSPSSRSSPCATRMVLITSSQVPFDYHHYGSFDPSSFPNIGIAPPYSPPESFTQNSTNSTTGADVAHDDPPKPVSTENADDHVADRKSGSGRSSSEEKDTLTPAQSRRKAQNRAAYVD